MASNHTSIFKEFKYQTNNGEVIFNIYFKNNLTSYAYPSSKEVMTIGENAFDDIQVESLNDIVMVKDIQQIYRNHFIRIVHNTNNTLFINYEKQSQEVSKAYIGDHVFIDGIWFEVQEEGLSILSHGDIHSELIVLNNDEPEAVDTDYNDYHRSPRIIHREPTETIKIERPPQPVQKNNTMIWRAIIPPLVMIALTVIIFLVRPIGVYILLMLGMSTVTIIFGITTYFTEKRNIKKMSKTRERL